MKFPETHFPLSLGTGQGAVLMLSEIFIPFYTSPPNPRLLHPPAYSTCPHGWRLKFKVKVKLNLFFTC